MKPAEFPLVAQRAVAPLDFAAPAPLDAQPGDTIVDVYRRARFALPVIAFLNGEIVTGDFWDCPLDAGDMLLFVVLPGGGDGGKDVLRFVMQLAITVAATYFLGPAGLGLTGAALSGGVAVATLAGGYLVNTLIPPTAAAAQGFNSGAAASPTYSLSPQGNQARLGGTIPKLYGRHLIRPDFVAQPYSEYRGNDLYLHEIFGNGMGLYEVESIRLAALEVWNADTGYSDTFSDIEFEIVAPGNPVTLFPAAVLVSDLVSGQELLGANEDGTGWIGPFPCSPAGDEPTKLAFDLVFAAGAGHLQDSGKIAERQIKLRIEVQEIDDIGTPTGDWVLLDEPEFSFATRTAQRISLDYAVEAPRKQARMKRTNDAATEGRDWDKVTWDAMRGYLPGDTTFPCSTIAMRARATNQLSSQTARDVTVVQTSMLPSWDGEAWTAPTATRALFDIACDVLMNEDYGGNHPQDRIDIETLMSLHETWAARGETFDGVFDQAQSVWDVLQDVLAVGRTRAYEVGDTICFVRDEKQTVPKMLLSPRQIVEGSFSIDYNLFDPTTPDAALVEYVDERTWDLGASVVASLSGETPANPNRLPVKGITDRERAWKHGMYTLAAAYYRRETVSADTEYDGRLLAPLDLVAVAHPLCDWGRAADVVSFDAEARRLRLSQKAQIPAGGDTYLRLRRPNGRGWGPVKIGKGAGAYGIEIDADEFAGLIEVQGDPFEWIVTAAGEDEPTTAMIGAGEMFLRDTKLFGTRPSEEKVPLTLIVDDDRVYTAGETGAPPAEATPSRLPATQAGPEIASFNVAVRGTRFNPILDVSWSPAAGALNYILQLSYDHVHFDTVAAGLQTTWSGPVSPTTLWVRATAIGAVRGPFKEVFFDLTAADAPPAGVTAISTIAFADSAWVKFTLPDEDKIEGVMARYSDESGFDPETEGVSINYSGPVTQVTVPLIGAPGPTYVRVAAYNVFGTTGLNWSTELAISSTKLTAANLSEAIVQSLATADTLEGNFVLRKGVGDFIGGMSLVGDGSAGDPIEAAFLVDKFTVAVPDPEDPDSFTYVPVFQIQEDGTVRINDLIAGSITAEQVTAALVAAGTIEGLRFKSPGATPFIDINAVEGEEYFRIRTSS